MQPFFPFGNSVQICQTVKQINLLFPLPPSYGFLHYYWPFGQPWWCLITTKHGNTLAKLRAQMHLPR